MSTLVIQLPARQRHGAADPQAAPEYSHVLSRDGLGASAQGRASAGQLPRADTVVAVLPATEVAWHRLPLPRAPAARLRAALAGLLEERLLEDEDQVHLALAPQARAGEASWVAALHRPWLAGHLAALENAGVAVERVVPALAPDAAAHGHFFADPGLGEEGADPAEPWLALADEDGLRTLRLGGGLARQLQPAWLARGARWTAEPAAAAAAERWVGAPVAVQAEAEALLEAARSPWNLRQFDLAPHHRGLRALREAGKRLGSPAWRPVRWGLAALVLLQVIGLNLQAWQQQRLMAERQQAMDRLLKESHPQVRAVLDAPLQMRRETELLRAAAGRTGDADFEPMLALAAQAWPAGLPPVQALRYEPGKLTLTAPGWNAAQIEQFRSRAQAGGATVESADGRLVLNRGGTPSKGS